jgi:DNA recombination protein RmuC
MAEEILLLAGGLLLGGGVAYLLLRRRGGDADATLHRLHQQMNERLDQVAQQVNLRLRENVDAVNESKSFLAHRVSATEQAARDVSTHLGKLSEATVAMQRTNEEIASFQKMLRSPKVRGSFGEVLLANVLADVLPADRYELQYTFRATQEVADAVIYLQDGYCVAIDAKFPLANYERLHAAVDEEGKSAARREFLRDVKKHIAAIGSKYIVPQEKTLEYAFMYIPLEGVYYEIMIHDKEGESLWQYCLTHKVLPVSPNSFLAYLQTVLIGLRGMRIQQQAKEILETLGQMRRDFTKFGEQFSMVGTHLANAKNRYDDSARQLDRMGTRLEHIDATAPTAALPPSGEDET